MAGIYLHIPFCKQKCHYCNFFSLASQKHKGEFLSVLLQEIKERRRYLDSEKIQTIYLGGGTPSVLSSDELQLIFEQIDHYYEVAQDAEITLEANPDDLSKEYLKKLKNTPINRLSIGVQSFHDDDLKYLNRIHSGSEALERIQLAQSLGFENLTLDLIYGIPTLTKEKWEQNLAQFFRLGIPHLSAYSLTIEPKTALHQLIKKNKVQNISDEQSIQHFQILQDEIKQHGFEHYEISNFCKPGYISKHNSLYWLGAHYLGLGPSAHSFNGVSRQWNISNLKQYIELGNQSDLVYEKEILSKDQQLNEYIMTSLRTHWGCSLEHISHVFGSKYADQILRDSKAFIDSEKIFIKNKTLYLTDKGKLFADGIAAELFV